MRLLLDTAVLIYAVEFPHRLSRRAAAALEDLDHALELSTISIAEIAIKAASGKLAFSAAAARRAMDELGIRLPPYSADHTPAGSSIFLAITAIPSIARSFAQARCEKIYVVTPDERFALYEGVRVLW
jgi:PIN domain nuclease of toxin-antitoxin system